VHGGTEGGKKKGRRMNLVETIVKAWEVGYTMFYSKVGNVKSVKDRTLSVEIEGAESAKVRHFFPGKPSSDADCVIIYPDNSAERAIAIGFSKFDEVKTAIAKKVEILINETEVSIKLGTSTFKMTENLVSIECTDLKVKGKLEIDGEATLKQKLTIEDETEMKKKLTVKEIEADDDVKVGSISLKTHIHSYTDTPIGPSVTQGPQ
jgi:hypothetical protein